MAIQLSDHFNYKRLFQFTLPSIIMMIFSSIYGVVDGFFVSNYAGKTAFAAVNFIMPVLMIVSTVGFMYGTGGSAIVAKTLGEGKNKKANMYFSLFVYFALFLGTIISILSFIFMTPIATMLGAKGELLTNSVIYARIILATLPFYILQMMFQSFFVTAQKPKLGLFVTFLSGMTNIILDATLVPLASVEHKLIAAAIATAASQLVGGALPLFYFSRPNSSLLKLGKTKFDPRIILKGTINGSSEFMSNVAMSIVGMLYNIQLLKYAQENGVAAYGVMMYVSMIFAAAFIGYTVGVAPVIGYHDGAKHEDELKSLRKKSIRIITVLGISMFIAAELLAIPLAKIFVGYDASLMALTISGFRIFALSFLFMGFSIFGSSFFTALNDGITSAIISFLRTFVFQTAAVLILPLFLQIDGVWVSIVVAEFIALLLTITFLIIKQKQFHY